MCEPMKRFRHLPEYYGNGPSRASFSDYLRIHGAPSRADSSDANTAPTSGDGGVVAQMRAKKTSTVRNAASAGNGVAHDVIERRVAIKEFVKYAEGIARDKDAARSVVRRAGIITKTGRLTKYYKT